MRYVGKKMEQHGRIMITKYSFRDGSVRVVRHKIDKTHPRARRRGVVVDLFTEMAKLKAEVEAIKGMVKSLVDALS